MQARCSKVNGETRLQSSTIQRKNYWSLQNPAWGSGKINILTSSMHYVQRLSSLHFLHIFAAISYCLMPQIVVRGHPLGGSSTAHAPCRVRCTQYILCTAWPALGMTNKGFQFLINFKLSCCRHCLRCSQPPI